MTPPIYAFYFFITKGCIPNRNIIECSERTVEMIGGKWKLRIIYMLAFHEVLRYGELKKLLTPITHKMLTNQLRELEKDKLVSRKEYQQIPPHLFIDSSKS